AVLRALGGRRRDIVVVVLSQALMIAGAGVFLGLVLLAALLNATRGSAVPSHMPAFVPPALAAAAIIVSILGSLVALAQALRAEPASVFH
ncbi:MAG TPA: FtsX-like permease family protein, partial [Phycisphaerae bacterium]|nr:FtsX-like permease family protein [Phycisphaerae bacterium]